MESTTIPLPAISKALNCSDSLSRKIIRQLAEKGCIELEQTRKGHLIKVFLPNELEIQAPNRENNKIDIEEISFVFIAVP